MAFAATNVDDIVILAVLFARRGPGFGTPQIVAGTVLGFGVLVGLSFAASVGLVALPDAAVGLLGLVPIALGVRGLVLARRAADDDEEAVGAAGLSALGVASITIANGADNVAVYAPLFATFGPRDAAVTLIVFAVLLGMLCAAGLAIGSRRAVVRAVAWAGDYAVPVVLIALGVFIVAESGLL